MRNTKSDLHECRLFNQSVKIAVHGRGHTLSLKSAATIHNSKVAANIQFNVI